MRRSLARARFVAPPRPCDFGQHRLIDRRHIISIGTVSEQRGFSVAASISIHARFTRRCMQRAKGEREISFRRGDKTQKKASCSFVFAIWATYFAMRSVAKAARAAREGLRHHSPSAKAFGAGAARLEYLSGLRYWPKPGSPYEKATGFSRFAFARQPDNWFRMLVCAAHLSDLGRRKQSKRMYCSGIIQAPHCDPGSTPGMRILWRSG